MHNSSLNDQALPITATKVLFPQHVFSATATIQNSGLDSKGCWFITDLTPFHPVSHIWPDHPADRGHIEFEGQSLPVIDCQTGAVNTTTGEVQIGEAITARRSDEDWLFVVVHYVQRTTPLPQRELVELQVDPAYQHALSLGHTAGHLASMALNKVLAKSYWRKEADRRDPLGQPDFNSYAQQKSEVTEFQCVDLYRLGKTLRKRGLNSAEVVDDLPIIVSSVNEQLAAWLSQPSVVHLRCEGERLTDSRYWECQLSEESQRAIMPCGGTHVTHLKAFESISVDLILVDHQTIKMHTCAKPAAVKD